MFRRKLTVPDASSRRPRTCSAPVPVRDSIQADLIHRLGPAHLPKSPSTNHTGERPAIGAITSGRRSSTGVASQIRRAMAGVSRNRDRGWATHDKDASSPAHAIARRVVSMSRSAKAFALRSIADAIETFNSPIHQLTNGWSYFPCARVMAAKSAFLVASEPVNSSSGNLLTFLSMSA